MSKSLFNIIWDRQQPSVEQVCERYGLQPHELDAQFGIIKIDEGNLYSILVDEDAVERVREQFSDDASIEGPFSNPPQELAGPFGPPTT